MRRAQLLDPAREHLVRFKVRVRVEGRVRVEVRVRLDAGKG